MIQINFDGACEPNPDGTASYGWLIKRDGVIIAHDAQIIGSGKGMTNNVAEYTGLIKSIEALSDLKLEKDEIRIFGDSNIVCNTVAREWGWKGKKNKKIWDPHRGAPHLRVLFDKVDNLLKEYTFKIKWVPREENAEADEFSKRPLIEAGIVKPESEDELCIKCSGKLVLRKGPYGQFFGCSNYPKCRYIKN